MPQAYWVTPLGWYHLIVFGLLIPLGAVRGRRKLAARPLPSRTRHFVLTTVTLMLFCALSLWTARDHALPLFPRAWPRPAGVVAGAVLLIVAVGFMRPRWRRAVERRARIAYLFMPRSGPERALWTLVAATAGVSEETIWRGVQPALLWAVVGDPYLAAGLSAVSFGVAHMLQGWRSAVVVTGLALGFQIVVVLSGSLYVAMAVHFIYDLTAGLTYGRLGRELGYPDAPQPPAAPVEAGTAGGPGL